MAARPEEVQRYGFPPLPDNREHLKRYRRVFNQWYYCASWIGLDGDGSGDVFQAGVECEVYRSGSSITRVNIRDVDGILITPTIIRCRYVGPIP